MGTSTERYQRKKKRRNNQNDREDNIRKKLENIIFENKENSTAQNLTLNN